ncbi:hypothetical protein [Brevibacillus laterosporus]|uniref:hypothetical protein n=1 Tax=Brevibacillus laterosporus TaxID=1465 RepID=UPI000B9A9180|nr:hypothetical protein [Brevibacillus laterosporus]MBG9787881.1 hypothetical protein [Brevibacillus laterosporus]MED1787947.1 hypothetical protein [Brevibacillus laterosporus]
MKLKKYILILCSVGFCTGLMLSTQITGIASSKSQIKIDPETGNPDIKTVLINKQYYDNQERKFKKNSMSTQNKEENHDERTIQLVNGVDKSIVAEIPLKEFFENNDYYEDLLSEATEKALEEQRKGNE